MPSGTYWWTTIHAKAVRGEDDVREGGRREERRAGREKEGCSLITPPSMPTQK
jgi:hypothetical protein